MDQNPKKTTLASIFPIITLFLLIYITIFYIIVYQSPNHVKNILYQLKIISKIHVTFMFVSKATTKYI